MSAESRRLHLRFSMQREEQKSAYEAISAIPSGRRMEYLCGLINKEVHALDVERRVLAAVRQALEEYRPQLQLSGKSCYRKNESTVEEIPQQMMDFLGML